MVRIHPDPPEFAGAVAQLGEHLLCKQGVVGSIPSSSTIELGDRPPGWRHGGTESRSKRHAFFALLFASGFLNQCYRLFFNNTEEVKQSCSTSGSDGASPCFGAESGMGWIVSTCRSL